MKREVLHEFCVLRLVAVLCLGAILLSFCVKKVPDKIEWAPSMEDALKIAQKQNKHIIADFWKDG
jgi:hypothetical protein